MVLKCGSKSHEFSSTVFIHVTFPPFGTNAFFHRVGLESCKVCVVGGVGGNWHFFVFVYGVNQCDFNSDFIFDRRPGRKW